MQNDVWGGLARVSEMASGDGAMMPKNLQGLEEADMALVVSERNLDNLKQRYGRPSCFAGPALRRPFWLKI
jgi:hypothetical protein